MPRARRGLMEKLISNRPMLALKNCLAFESVDCPFFELLERDVCCWRGAVEIESMLVLQLLELGFRKLCFLEMNVCSSFDVNT